MNYRKASLVGSVMVFACLGLASCSNNDEPAIGGFGGASTSGAGGVGTGGSGTSVSGGSSATGGTSNTSQGGATAAGGQSTSTGGTSSQGGAATGGAATGGSNQGGSNQGGSNQGGSNQGGTSATGGSTVVATGGSAVGGAAAGGVSNQGGAATGGAAAGGAAAGGTAAGGATSSPVTPTMVSASDYRFTMTACNNLVMDVNPQIGARVTTLKLGSTDIIKPYTCTSYSPDSTTCPNSSGSTFWTSPQTGWSPTWPPPAAIDGNAYAPNISGSHLVATGSADTALGASVTKDFSADGGTCWISLLYTIKATKAIQVAPWQISRVPRGGLAFFPKGTTVTPGPLATYTTTSTATTPNIVWFDDSAKTATNVSGSKLVGDGASGWLAYALGGNLFIKKYTDVLTASFAPNEGDIEIYADLSGYLELEVQGPYTSLAANGTLPWTVQWRVVPIPSSVTVAVGSASLVTFVQQQVAM